MRLNLPYLGQTMDGRAFLVASISTFVALGGQHPAHAQTTPTPTQPVAAKDKALPQTPPAQLSASPPATVASAPLGAAQKRAAAPPPPPPPPPPAWTRCPMDTIRYTDPLSGQASCVPYREETVYSNAAIVAGSLLIGIPYLIGISVAASNEFSAPSGYHAIPIAGPWVHLAKMDYSCPKEVEPAGRCATKTLGNVFMTMGNIISGGSQLAGAITLAVGLTSGKKALVPDFAHFNIMPAPSGAAITYQTRF